ncbi:hypothetical protein F5Y18DRAFT_156585 [Xylariaceae sp. FL1019]|nr:hypothetical protein F5Y18DRAFT_156585 [Xylariaceae sp. FL1019]
MGIKGIYKEIGAGKRISLTKLAVDKLEESGRPLRIAIDISIWQFQVQAARGGSNPAIRTLFYRLLRLLSSSIQPIFVFDGPNKPTFKRNKRSGRGDGVATAMAKRLIRLFGFVSHDAPGEAEAECALLQQNGIVDAVLSEDVDTIMFGCTRTLRNWSSEGTKGSKAPTHVSMYDSAELSQGASGLDREGMVLVALMSGGDYLPEGVPGAGVKLACEAAKAGFGKSLCQLKRADTSELASWKEWLIYELRHNESGFFRTRHKALNIPDDFPNMDILRYYTHPVVSSATAMERLKQQEWDRPIDVQGLREFVRETFDWSYRIGAIKYIRVLAPCLLIRKMIQRSSTSDHSSASVDVTEKEESELVKSITSRRAHFSTDATSELRMSFIPTNIVGYNFQEEPDEVIEFGRDGLALNSDDEIEELGDEAGDVDSTGKSAARKPFSPTEADLAWIPETIAKLGVPLMVETWEATQRAKAAAKAAPRPRAKTTRTKSKAGGMAAGALNHFVKVTKNNMADPAGFEKAKSPLPAQGTVPPARSRTPLEPVPNASQSLSSLLPSSQVSQKSQHPRPSKQPTSKSRPTRSSRKLPAEPKADANTNPWTIAGSQAETRASKATEPILISSSPPTAPAKDTFLSRVPDPEASDNGDSFSLPPLSLSPRRRGSMTPSRPTTSGSSSSLIPAVRQLSPIPPSNEKPQRKLARTESLPAGPTSPVRAEKGRTRGFTRAKTVAVETVLLDSDEEDDFELPPLSSLVGQIPKSTPSHPTNPVNSTTNTNPSTNLTPTLPSKFISTQTPKKATATKQATLDAFGVRMTKLYVPRDTQPGFFDEVEVSVDQVDALRQRYEDGGKGRRKSVWRQSDVSCVDLTGDGED